ncbi:MAG: aryl-sulfate sulfotransferase [Ignavibacteriales bacterium]|nr:aryl-sulfate sulfotransferase [Ignavibacteriales bacterium]
MFTDLRQRHGEARVLAFPFALVLVLAGCESPPVVPEGSKAFPVVRNISIQPSPYNEVSVIVTASVKNVVLAAAKFQSQEHGVESTPFLPVSGESLRIPVYGLRGSTSYTMRILVRLNSGQEVLSESVQIQTRDLPDDIPSLVVQSHIQPTPGYVMIGFIGAPVLPRYAIIVDNQGRVVWYRQFHSAVADFQLQPNNNYTLYGSLAGESQRFYELDRNGDVVGEYLSVASPETGVHELRLFPIGHALYGVDRRIMDLSHMGGQAIAEVRGVVIELRREGRPLFTWNTFDHFEITEASDEISLAGASVNPWHSNAIEVDSDGHLLVSFRNSDEVTKIDSETGTIIWRLNGKKNQFTFLNDPLSGFSHQHGIRRLPNGNIILFDNGNLHTPPQSRAVEYRLDEAALTATLVWEYRPVPSLFGAATGFAQRLADGNTLICFGTANRIQEVTPDGSVQWDLELTTGGQFFYRALRIDSLY